MNPRWLAAALGVSAGAVLASPLLAQLSTALRAWLGREFAFVMAIAVGGVAAAALIPALVRVRQRRVQRGAAVAAGLVLALAYAAWSRTGQADVDAVERVHFVQYGLITALFYAAWRRSGDWSLLVLPVMASTIVALCEEWLQWFLPSRVGELRDVGLNLSASASVLLICLGLAPPPRLAPRLTAASRRHLGWAGAALVCACAAFVHAVHLGHEIVDAQSGTFRSRYSVGELASLAAARARQWKAAPPRHASLWSREDQYLGEGLAHIRRRNDAWDAGEFSAARAENLILEKYFAPVLDIPTTGSPGGHRWPDEQRAHAEQAHAAAGASGVYASDALPLIVLWPPWMLWMAAAAIVAALLRALRVGAM
jgi:hypothetical protein